MAFALKNPQKKLRVAVIGCGRISVLHFAAIAESGLAELVAVCDIKRHRAEKAAAEWGGTVYTDYSELLERERPDAIHICLPHYLHVPVALEAFARGISVLCEKPMAISLEDAERAVAAAKKAHVTYGIISQCRYNDPSRFVRRALDEGKLGKILTVRSILTWSRPDSYYAQSDWKGTWDKEGGGVVIDQAIHSIDLVNWLVGSPVRSVACNLVNRGHSRIAVEDTAEGLVTFENGVRYAFYCMNNFATDEPIEILLVCEKGKARFSYDDAVIEYANGEKETCTQQPYLSRECMGALEGSVKDYWGYQHVRQVTQFYRAVLKTEPLEIDGEEALKTHRLIAEIYKTGWKK